MLDDVLLRWHISPACVVNVVWSMCVQSSGFDLSACTIIILSTDPQVESHEHCCHIHDIKLLVPLVPLVLQEALEQYYEAVSKRLQKYGGYLVEAAGGLTLAAFPAPIAAVSWCLACSNAMVNMVRLAEWLVVWFSFKLRRSALCAFFVLTRTAGAIINLRHAMSQPAP